VNSVYVFTGLARRTNMFYSDTPITLNTMAFGGINHFVDGALELSKTLMGTEIIFLFNGHKVSVKYDKNVNDDVQKINAASKYFETVRDYPNTTSQGQR
jgi:hypothetical protein